MPQNLAFVLSYSMLAPSYFHVALDKKINKQEYDWRQLLFQLEHYFELQKHFCLIFFLSTEFLGGFTF